MENFVLLNAALVAVCSLCVATAAAATTTYYYYYYYYYYYLSSQSAGRSAYAIIRIAFIINRTSAGNQMVPPHKAAAWPVVVQR
jgi:hypothetical protein